MLHIVCEDVHAGLRLRILGFLERDTPLCKRGEGRIWSGSIGEIRRGCDYRVVTIVNRRCSLGIERIRTEPKLMCEGKPCEVRLTFSSISKVSVSGAEMAARVCAVTSAIKSGSSSLSLLVRRSKPAVKVHLSVRTSEENAVVEEAGEEMGEGTITEFCPNLM